MKKSLIKSAVLGGIVVFVWGFISWMVLPWHMMTMEKFSDEKQVASMLQKDTDRSGVYVLPYMCHKGMGMSKEERHKEMEKSKEMMKEGPFVFAVVQKSGMNTDMTTKMFIGLIIQIVSAFFITWMLLQTKAMSYMRQVGFVTMFGLIAGFLVVLPGWNWMGFPCAYTLVSMLDLIIAWFLAGLVIAKLAKK